MRKYLNPRTDQNGWFAEHGIDVNNPAFGRWVSVYDHRTWHSGIRMGQGGRFNNAWKQFINAERQLNPPRAYTYTEIMDKLANMRTEFAVTSGHN
jgi:Predicted lipoprotein of unknown function (DUF2380)